MPIRRLTASALLFDMDGTLVDSNASVERAWAHWSNRHGLLLSEVLEYSHGRPTLATMQHFGDRITPGKDWKPEADEMQQMEQTEISGTVAIPGALEILQQIPEDRWAVVTSAPRKLAESRLVAAGLPLPCLLIPADEITIGKPHPEGYLKAASTLGIHPSECVVFEDTPPGIEAGLNAGMQVIGLLTTVRADRLKTTNLIQNYLDLRISHLNGHFELELKP